MRSRSVILNIVRLALLAIGVLCWVRASRYSDPAVMCTAVYSGHYPDEVSRNIQATCAELWRQTKKFFLLGGLSFSLIVISFFWRRIRIALTKAGEQPHLATQTVASVGSEEPGSFPPERER